MAGSPFYSSYETHRVAARQFFDFTLAPVTEAGNPFLSKKT